MSSDIAISVRNLTKTYRIFGHPGDRIKQALTFGRIPFHCEFTALKDVSFDIRRGETVGIIGCNGSGKSTLLQLVSGILKPSSGSIQVNGRVSALLELGSGFNPEFTGRENVFFQGAIMGLSRAEMAARFDDIAAFADIGEFIDRPLRMYSSGMFVRLAFSTMIHMDADVLVIDEALAVGDELFQRKCFDKLTDYLEGENKTMFFVSHNTRQLERLCSRVIWLEDGWVIRQGIAGDVCTAYQNRTNELLQKMHSSQKFQPNIVYSGELDVTRLQLFQGDCALPVDTVEMHSPAKIVIDFHCNSILTALDIVIRFHTTDSIFIAAASTANTNKPSDFSIGNHRVECRLHDLTLLPGVYQIRLGFLDRRIRPVWVGHGVYTFRIVGKSGSNIMRISPGLVDMPFEWVLDPPQSEQ